MNILFHHEEHEAHEDYIPTSIFMRFMFFMVLI